MEGDLLNTQEYRCQTEQALPTHASLNKTEQASQQVQNSKHSTDCPTPACFISHIRTGHRQIDVLVLYTHRAMNPSDALEGTSPRTTQQMESIIATAYAGANDALKYSGLPITLNVVHTQLVSTAVE